MKNLTDKCGKGEGSEDKGGGPGAPLDISQPITMSSQEPQAQLMVGNKPPDCLLDTEATYSVWNTKVTKRSWDAVRVTGRLDNYKPRRPFKPWNASLRTGDCTQLSLHVGWSQSISRLRFTFPIKCTNNFFS